MHIGEKIKARRVELGWSQRDLAERMGYKSHSVIARIEAGIIDLNQSRLDQFASVLGVSHAYLLGLVSEEESKKNDQLAKLIVRLRADADFYNTVASLANLVDSNQRQFKLVQQLIATFEE